MFLHSRVLVLDAPIPQTLDAFVSLGDKIIISVVRAIAGMERYSFDLRLMSNVAVFVGLLMLRGKDGVSMPSCVSGDFFFI